MKTFASFVFFSMFSLGYSGSGQYLLVRGLAMSFLGHVCHWTSSGTQLSPVAPLAVACNSSHILGTGFGKLAKPGENNWRVSNPRWVWIGLCQHAKPDSRWNKWKSSPEEPIDVKVVAASIVGAPRAGYGTQRSPGHPLQPGSLPSSRLSVPQDQDFQGQESGIAPVHWSSHYKT